MNDKGNTIDDAIERTINPKEIQIGLVERNGIDFHLHADYIEGYLEVERQKNNQVKILDYYNHNDGDSELMKKLKIKALEHSTSISHSYDGLLAIRDSLNDGTHPIFKELELDLSDDQRDIVKKDIENFKIYIAERIHSIGTGLKLYTDDVFRLQYVQGQGELAKKYIDLEKKLDTQDLNIKLTLLKEVEKLEDRELLSEEFPTQMYLLEKYEEGNDDFDINYLYTMKKMVA